MPRLFVAIRPPPPMRHALLAAMGGGAGLRWQDDEQLHLTLRFLGEVDRHRAEDIAVALARVRQPPIAFAAAGVGLFDRRGRPHSLWAGVVPAEPFTALHRRIGQALRLAGVAPDVRAYHPHVTLARCGALSAGIDGVVARLAGLATPIAVADRFTLYESRLGGEAAHYTALEEYPLR